MSGRYRVHQAVTRGSSGCLSGTPAKLCGVGSVNFGVVGQDGNSPEQSLEHGALSARFGSNKSLTCGNFRDAEVSGLALADNARADPGLEIRPDSEMVLHRQDDNVSVAGDHHIDDNTITR
jgi:hypothetical protein